MPQSPGALLVKYMPHGFVAPLVIQVRASSYPEKSTPENEGLFPVIVSHPAEGQTSSLLDWGVPVRTTFGSVVRRA